MAAQLIHVPNTPCVTADRHMKYFYSFGPCAAFRSCSLHVQNDTAAKLVITDERMHSLLCPGNSSLN